MAFLKEDEINKIRQSADIVEIISDYLPLQKKGKNYVCICPFHDDHKPSMVVSSERQIFNCFTCGVGGNVFTFLMKYENISFPEALEIVAKKIGYRIDITHDKKIDNKFNKEYELYDFVTKFYINNLNTLSGAKAKKYLQERGINESIIKEFKIGLSLDQKDALTSILLKKNYSVDLLDDLGLVNKYDENVYDRFINRIMIPIDNLSGQIVGFTARIFNNEDAAKYINTKETVIFKKGDILFNYYNAKNSIKKEKQVIVVEGNMDAIKLSSSGIKNVVALMGVSLSKIQIDTLKKLKVPIVLLLDSDNAGEVATVKLGQTLIDNNLNVSVVRLKNAKDPDEFINSFGVDKLKSVLNNPTNFIDFKLEYLKNGKNLNSIEDLSQYIKESLEVLKNRDDLEQELFINKLSKEYNIDINLLKRNISINKSKEEKKEEVVSKKRVSKYEKIVSKLLYAMMNDAKYISIYKNKISYFNDLTDRIIASEIVYYNKEHNGINIADFLSFIMTNEEVYDKVLTIINQNELFAVSDLEFNACVDTYLMLRNKLEINEIKDKIKKESNEDKKLEFLQKLAELKKGSVDNERN